MESLELHIADANHSNLPDLIKFYKSYFPNDSRIFKPGYLEWLLLSNPCGVAKCVMITLNSEIIANMFLIPIFLSVKGEEKLGYFAAEVLSHPKHRDKNLFVKMIRKATEYLKKRKLILVGHPNNASTPGWKRTKMNFYNSYASFLSKVSTNVFNSKLVRIQNEKMLSKFSKDLDRISTSKTVIKSNFDFVCWKYLNNPVKKYEVNIVVIEGVVRGMIVSYRYKKIIRRIVHYIVEEGYEKQVFNATILPSIYSFPQTSTFNEISHCFYNKSIGDEIKFFFTVFDEYDVDPTYVTFAACDN